MQLRWRETQVVISFIFRSSSLVVLQKTEKWLFFYILQLSVVRNLAEGHYHPSSLVHAYISTAECRSCLFMPWSTAASKQTPAFEIMDSAVLVWIKTSGAIRVVITRVTKKIRWKIRNRSTILRFYFQSLKSGMTIEYFY